MDFDKTMSFNFEKEKNEKAKEILIFVSGGKTLQTA